MTRFLVTGASGLLGLHLSLQISKKDDLLGIIHENTLRNAPFKTVAMDLTKGKAVTEMLESFSPDIVIHCAAMANLESCENNPEAAYQINALVPGRLAAECRRRNIKLIHISTDAVFDGINGNYSEDDPTSPLSIYGRTKKEGEIQVLHENPDAIVARVNFFGWSQSGNRSLGEFFYNNLKDGKQVNGFVDINFCPLYVNQLSDLLLEMAQKKLSGVYHVVSADHMTKYEFGRAIAQQFGFDEQLINPISVIDSHLSAPRSHNLTLSTDKLAFDLQRKLPTIQDGIQQFYNDFYNGYAGKIRDFSNPTGN